MCSDSKNISNKNYFQMEKSKKWNFGLVLFLILLTIISFGTKGAHLDKLHSVKYWEDEEPNVYRPLEGCIALDVFLIIFYVVLLLLICRPNEYFEKVIFICFLILMFMRFLLGVIFLAGEDEYGRKTVNHWLTMGKDNQNKLDPATRDYYSTFEGAYVYEIIDIIMLSILGPVMLLIWRGEVKQTQT